MNHLTLAAQAFGAIAAVVVALTVLGKAVLGIYRAAARIEHTYTLVNHELKPNGGGSIRDAIDRIEEKADHAAVDAKDAVVQATSAAKHSAQALERIERIEQSRPNAVAIALSPNHPKEAT